MIGHLRGHAPTWALLVALQGCWSPGEVISVDLLPPTSTGRIQQVVTIPPGTMELALSGRISSPGGATDVPPRLQVVVHTAAGADLVYERELDQQAGTIQETVDLSTYSDRKVLLSATVGGGPGLKVSWEKAVLSGSVPRWGGSSWGIGERTGVADQRGRPNLILYSIDALRGDLFGSAEAERILPNLVGLERGGTSFRNARSTSSWTRAAVGSLFTGLYPIAHGTMGRGDVLPEEVLTLAEVLLLEGYRTVGVTANPNIDAHWGFDQGFEVYMGARPTERGTSGRPAHPARAEVVHRLALEAIEANRDDAEERPLFLFLHVVDPHAPYSPPVWLMPSRRPSLVATPQLLTELTTGTRQVTADLIEELWTLYLGEVAYMDQAFGDFWDSLVHRGLVENAVLAVTSDHGEQFYEHGGFGHGLTLYDEEVHVPLFLWGAPHVPEQKMVSSPASLVDVHPTISALVGLESPHAQGVDLSGVWRGGAVDWSRPVLAELDHDGRRLRALQLESWKLIVDLRGGPPRLYNLAVDPGESEDLQERRVRLAASLVQTLEASFTELQTRRVGGGSLEPTPELLEQLRALGYVR